RVALELLYRVFEVCDGNWRGIGIVPDSGLRLRSEYRQYDAELVFEIDTGEPIEPRGCICGDILRGVRTPPECSLFRAVCNPENPVGPCMVSSEGSCAAYYQYGDGYGG
ncbi:MAG: hydrogenase formation protein HypD, partial [Dehalococcoidia bacterium]